MNVLMAVAVTGAWLIGEHAEAATVVFLFALSELLESWSVGRARRAIESLLKLAPETAHREKADGSFEEVPVSEIGIKEMILVRSGERVPLDGTIIDRQLRRESSAHHRRVRAGGKAARRSRLRRHHQWRGLAGGDGHEGGR